MQYYYMKIKAETKKHNDIFGGNDDYDGGYGGGQYDGSEYSFIRLILLSFSLFSFLLLYLIFLPLAFYFLSPLIFFIYSQQSIQHYMSSFYLFSSS